tara:strand:- start:780 stop:1001 length:222 start_codon:yes stop_codon:yes gene_type:complete
MPLTNPTPILHQNITTVMNMTPEEKEVRNDALMGPPKKRNVREDKMGDPMQPSRRIASYIEAIKKKREEVNNA